VLNSSICLDHTSYQPVACIITYKKHTQSFLIKDILESLEEMDSDLSSSDSASN